LKDDIAVIKVLGMRKATVHKNKLKANSQNEACRLQENTFTADRRGGNWELVWGIVVTCPSGVCGRAPAAKEIWHVLRITKQFC